MPVGAGRRAAVGGRAVSGWKDKLDGKIEPALAREIDIYETQLELKRRGKVEERLFNETRLRRGVYGQRYDNGQRHDGRRQRELRFPCGDVTKGLETMWDAPGMQRIKIPFGGLTPGQMEVLADVAEEHSVGVAHVTTRQDFQLHFVHIDDTPALMRRLASTGITTREACGNSVRNVTACPLAGVCREETFDVTPYAKALARFLLGHPDAQDFGRKFKVAFSGCEQSACGLVTMHDLGFIARTRQDNGVERRGFEMYVGGGLGAVPYQAKRFDEFVPAEEIPPLAQAISRVYARLGEKKNRGRARIKFLVAKLGIEEFRRLVLEERASLAKDPRWTTYLSEIAAKASPPLRPARALHGGPVPGGFTAWRATNVRAQRQPGYAVATVTLPLGDVSSSQLRRLAGIAQRFVGDEVRTTVEQNILFRYVSEADLPALYAELDALGLGTPGAGTVTNVIGCPGTDTCKLGIASSRGLTRELSSQLAARSDTLDESVRGLHIKVSGCFNACAQHHIADIGFYGVSRKMGGTTVPHFRVVLGGQWENNAASYGLTIGAVPSKRVPEFVDRLTGRYVTERVDGESFQGYVERIGKPALKALVDEFGEVPAFEVDASLYSDWRDPRIFTISDLTKGECAGEVVSRVAFDLQAAERLAFEAQLLLDQGEHRKADDAAYDAMLEAARGLLRTRLAGSPPDADALVQAFREHFCDTQLFYDRYAGAKFAQYLLRRHEDRERDYAPEAARHLVKEAELFIEAAHACHARMLEQGAATPPMPDSAREILPAA